MTRSLGDTLRETLNKVLGTSKKDKSEDVLTLGEDVLYYNVTKEVAYTEAMSLDKDYINQIISESEAGDVFIKRIEDKFVYSSDYDSAMENVYFKANSEGLKGEALTKHLTQASHDYLAEHALPVRIK